METNADVRTPPTDMASGTDLELAQRIAAGERALFELVMRRFNRRLFLIARSILGSEAEAEDAVQEAYLTGWRRLSDFRGPEGLGAWLSRIVTNIALMRLRRGRGHNCEDLDELATQLIDERRGPEEEVGSMQVTRLLEQAIDRLPPVYRTTYVLREVEQLSVMETAASLGIDPATVKTRLHRARRLLRRHLQATLSARAADAFPFAGTRCDRIVAETLARIATEAAARRSTH